MTYIFGGPCFGTQGHVNLRCGTEEETSVHRLCECEVLASLTHAYEGSFFLDPEDVTNINRGPSANLVNEKGSFNLVSEYGAQRAWFKA